MSKKYELTGIGNAIVDVISQGTDEFLQALEIQKGGMTLIDQMRAQKIYNSMGPGTETSGGSAANTMAGFASLGGKGAYMGKVADDQLGRIFAHDMKSVGIDFPTAPLRHGPETASCLIIVTPDGERSMNTFLGACVEFGETDIDEKTIQESQVVYLEGYLFDKDTAKSAYRKATKLATAAGAKTALSLSDAFCVERHRADFQALVKNEIDILFANENEIMALYQSKTFDEAVAAVRGACSIAALTRADKGCVIITKDTIDTVPAAPIAKLVDTTGAGDQFAAGFLFGLARGKSMVECAEIASLAAGEVISHVGPRPSISLADLIRDKRAA